MPNGAPRSNESPTAATIPTEEYNRIFTGSGADLAEVPGSETPIDVDGTLLAFEGTSFVTAGVRRFAFVASAPAPCLRWPEGFLDRQGYV